MRFQAGVVGNGIGPLGGQPGGDRIRPLAGPDVDDAGLPRVLIAHEGPQLLLVVVLQLHPVADVGPVEAGHKLSGLRQLELLDDVLTGVLVGRGRQGDFGDIAESLRHLRNAQVLGPEIVPPLRHAVRLVDREQGNGDSLEQPLKAFGHQTLRGDIQ